MKRALSQSWKFLSSHFQLIAVCLTVPGIIWALYSQREAIANFDWSLSPWKLAAAILLIAAGPIIQATSFADALRAFGPKPDLVDVILVWCRSFLLRYSPTGALAFIYRVRQSTRLQADNKEILAATAYEQYAVLQAGLTLAVLCFWLDGGSIPIWALGLFTLGLLIALLVRPSLLGSTVEKIIANRGIELPRLLRGRRVIPIIALNILAWSSVAAGNYLLLSSLAPDSGLSLLYFAAVFILACVIGIIVPMLPGGLGVREAMIVLLLAPVMPAAVATTLAIGLRIIGTLAEFVSIAIGEVAYLVKRRLGRYSQPRQDQR